MGGRTARYRKCTKQRKFISFSSRLLAKSSHMLKRTITAVVALALLSVVCIYSETIVFPIAFGLMALIGVYEMLGCIGMRRNFVVSACMYVTSVTAIVFTRTIKSDSLLICAYAAMLFCVLVIMFALAVFSGGTTPIDKVCIAFVTCAYVITGFMSIIMLRDLPHGKYIYLVAFAGPWVCDTFAYLCGRLFGKHKLIPEVSPKKTVEGSIGGTVFCVIACVIYHSTVKQAFDIKVGNILVFVFMGLVIAAVSQIGDLIMSLIKRRYGIKDFGFIFPGHGGVLDRFDSVIATAPLILIVCESLAKLGML